MMKKFFFLFLAFSFINYSSAVEFYEILNDPDNVVLNEKFAKERLSKGDLPAALSAIERVLNLKPTNTPLRLLRAELLVQLGNNSLAETELKALLKLPLGELQKSQVNNLMAIIEDRNSLTKNSISTSLILANTNNVNSYPSSGLLESFLNGNRTFSTYSSFDGESVATDDKSGQFIITYTNEYDLKNQDKDLLISRASVNVGRGDNSRYSNNRGFSIQSGLNLKRGDLLILPSVSYTKSKGDTKADNTLIRGSLNSIMPLAESLSGNLGISYSSLRHKNDPRFTTADQGDGDSIDLSFGVDKSIRPNLIGSSKLSLTKFQPYKSQFASGSAAYLSSQANERGTKSLNLSLTNLLTNDSRLQMGYTYTSSKNKFADITANKIRKDSNKTLSISYFKAGKEVSSALNDWNFIGTVNRTDNNSNISQFEFNKTDFSLVATRAFDF